MNNKINKTGVFLLFLVAGFLIGNLTKKVSHEKSDQIIPPYSFTSTPYFLAAYGIWDGDKFDGETTEIARIDCNFVDKTCLEILVEPNGLLLPIPVEYEIIENKDGRIVARRDGGAAVLTLDISTVSKVIEKTRSESGKVYRQTLVSGISAKL